MSIWMQIAEYEAEGMTLEEACELASISPEHREYYEGTV